MNSIIAIVILILVLTLMKRQIPSTFNLLNRFSFWALKGIAVRLWRKPERKGGGNIRTPRMRWKP